MDAQVEPETAPSNTFGPPAAQRKRRNRPALSCIQCRSRKTRCDRNEPCNACIKSKILNCSYEESRRPKPKFWPLSPGLTPSSSPTLGQAGPSGPGSAHLESRAAADDPHRRAVFHFSPGLPLASATAAPSHSSGTPGQVSASTPSSTSTHPHSRGDASADTAALTERVRQLERQLAETLNSGSAEKAPRASKLPSVVSKTRYFGASHWMNHAHVFSFLTTLVGKVDADKNSQVSTTLEQCKKLARLIKARRAPPTVGIELGKALPPEPVARRLAQAYFRTFGSVYSILHDPSFWQEFDKYWSNPAGTNQAFVMQMQLCMAIGTCFQDDVAALRRSATQWVYEAQFWFASPSEKSRLTLPGLQNMCLLHLAREVCGVAADLTWVSMGSVVRTAVQMGLHRDPEHFPKMSLLAAEMRRRLWAAILELALQSSLQSGGPPLISPADFDTRPPSNFDDDQLAEHDHFPPSPRVPGTLTQASVQIALLKSFPTRLSIAKYINDFRSVASYEDTLRLNSELGMACRTLSATLHALYSPPGASPGSASPFQLSMAEQMVHRFFIPLNHPWLPSAEKNPAYYFARKVCVETSLKLYRAFRGSPPDGQWSLSQLGDYQKLAISGAGPFRSVPLQCLATATLELYWQALEDRKFRQSMDVDQAGLVVGADAEPSVLTGSGAAPRAELVEAMNYGSEWTERRIRAGETNVRGYAFHTALKLYVEAVQLGADEAETERRIMDKALETVEYSRDLLREIAQELATPSDLDDTQAEPGTVPAEIPDVDLLWTEMADDWGWAWDDGVSFSHPHCTTRWPSS